MNRVLIVDDAAFMRVNLRMILERKGFEIAGEAENGKVALQKYKECHPEIVTMDITMPEMDGIDTLKAIREYDPQAKIVMISAMGQESLVRDAVLSGAKSFIVKPFKEDFVADILKKVLAG